KRNVAVSLLQQVLSYRRPCFLPRAAYLAIRSCRGRAALRVAGGPATTAKLSKLQCRRRPAHMSRSIWIDITELFDQFRLASYPTGVSRTVLKLADALAADPGQVFRAARLLFWHPIWRRPVTTEDSRIWPLAAFFPRLSMLYIAAGLAGA